MGIDDERRKSEGHELPRHEEGDRPTLQCDRRSWRRLLHTPQPLESDTL